MVRITLGNSKLNSARFFVEGFFTLRVVVAAMIAISGNVGLRFGIVEVNFEPVSDCSNDEKPFSLVLLLLLEVFVGARHVVTGSLVMRCSVNTKSHLRLFHCE